jgi:hypothetical protein
MCLKSESHPSPAGGRVTSCIQPFPGSGEKHSSHRAWNATTRSTDLLDADLTSRYLFETVNELGVYAVLCDDNSNIKQSIEISSFKVEKWNRS